jgi:hypothetical protein
MAKRFISTALWDEDWFLDMPPEYKLFWFYILSNCDFGGLFKVNLRSFCGLNGVKIDSNTALQYFNKDKQRIKVLDNQQVWFIEDFFAFQYGTTFNPENRVHASIEKLYLKYDLKMSSIRGLIDLKDRVKDKDKDKDKKEYNNSINLKRGYGGKTLKKKSAIFLDLELGRAYFTSDGTVFQELGEEQKKLLAENKLHYYEIFEGEIY